MLPNKNVNSEARASQTGALEPASASLSVLSTTESSRALAAQTRHVTRESLRDLIKSSPVRLSYRLGRSLKRQPRPLANRLIAQQLSANEPGPRRGREESRGSGREPSIWRRVSAQRRVHVAINYGGIQLRTPSSEGSHAHLLFLVMRFNYCSYRIITGSDMQTAGTPILSPRISSLCDNIVFYYTFVCSL